MVCRPCAAAVTVLALMAGSVHARGHLQARQTGVELPSGVRAGRLVLANSGDAPVAAQVRVYAWTQVDGEDRLDPSTALIASPPVADIQPGSEQLVRLVRPTVTAVDREQAFRVVVDELPGDPGAGMGSAVAVRMRFVLPAFVRAVDPAPPALRCKVDAAVLACENTGGRAAQLGATELMDAAGRKIEITPGLLGYVLAGSARRWPLDASKLAKLGVPSKLGVSLNGRPTTVDLFAAP